MDTIFEALRSGNIWAWAGLLVVGIIALRLLFKMSKWLLLLCILVALGYGFVHFFPEPAEAVLNWLRTFVPESSSEK